MRHESLFFAIIVLASMSIVCSAQQAGGQGELPSQGGDFSSNPKPKKLPSGVILVNGAVPSASDSSTPIPEAGTITERIYTNSYFGLSFTLPPGFTQKYVGPPPSENGFYVLAQIDPSPEFQAAAAGSILVSAQDLFFPLLPVSGVAELVRFKAAKLTADYKVERPPTEINIANHSFISLEFFAPAAELHWYTLATQIRCHEVEFTFTSRDPELLEKLVTGMQKITLPAGAGLSTGKGGGSVPICINDYATPDHVLHRVDPVLRDRKFNRIPVRIIIDRYGKVKHVHVLSAFPEQAKAITEALLQWEFRPYRVNGEPVEVETGITFGRSSSQTAKPPANRAGVSD